MKLEVKESYEGEWSHLSCCELKNKFDAAVAVAAGNLFSEELKKANYPDPIPIIKALDEITESLAKSYQKRLDSMKEEMLQWDPNAQHEVS